MEEKLTELLETIFETLDNQRSLYKEWHDSAENIDDKIFYTAQIGAIDTAKSLIEWKSELLGVKRRES